MSFSNENLAELNVLMLFNSSGSLDGIKIHHTAEPAVIAAAKRLHERGLITLADGGYLTSFGSQAMEHVQALHTVLNQ